MEFKRGDKTIKVPGWVIAAGIVKYELKTTNS